MVSRSGVIRVGGGYRTRERRWLRRGVDWKWRATGCGAQLSFPARRGDRYEYSTFFVDDGSLPTLRGAVLSDERQRVTFSPAPVRVSRARGYVSGLDPRLVRARTVLRARRSGTMRITTCAR